MTHVWWWRKYQPDRKGQPCKVVCTWGPGGSTATYTRIDHGPQLHSRRQGRTEMAKPQKLPNGKYKVEKMLGGERHSRTFDLRRDAVAWERQVTADFDRGVFIPPDRLRERVGDRLDEWLDIRAEDPNFAPSSHALYSLFVRKHIKPYLGNLTMEHLGVEQIEAWRNQLVKERTTNTALKGLQILSSFLTDQQRYGYIPANPAKLVKAPPHRRKQMTVLEPHELQALVEASKGKSCSYVGPDGRSHAMGEDHPQWELRSGWSADIVLGLALIGCRIGDLAVLVEENWDRINGKLNIWDEKADKWRWIPVFPAVEEVLERCVARGGEFLFMCDGKRGQSRIWPAWNREHFRPALKDAGIGRDLVPHELRHTCASWLIRQGFSPVQVAAYLGHASPAVTMKTYAHLFADDMQDLGEAMDQMWQQAKRGPGPNVTPIRRAE